jgi:DNA-binding NarL/FixJ family response regulator
VLLDAALPPESVAVELTRLILSYFPNAKIVILGSPDTLSNVLNCIEAGASGYVSKRESLQGLAQALQQCVVGEMPISNDLTVMAFSRLAELSRRSGKIEMLESRLTLREITVVKLIADGQTNKQIADSLSLSVHTVKNHVHNILEKLAIQTRADAAKYIAGRHWFAVRKTSSSDSTSSGRRGRAPPAAELPIRRRPAD